MKDGFLLINKPSGPTSHDIINSVRRITGIKKVGHAGTLDPFAGGLLLIGIGRSATKKMSKFAGLDKEYEAVFVIGASSDTDDLKGKIEMSEKKCATTNKEIEIVTKSFLGEIEQIPPIYSAIKINGEKMYALARKGEKIERKPRKVKIYKFDLIEFLPKTDNLIRIKVKIACSSGTYIRAIARDLGEKLQTGGYVESLCRTKIGHCQLADAVSIQKLSSSKIDPFLIPVDSIEKIA